MEVQGFFEMFFGFLRSLFDMLSDYSLSAFGANVPITSIIFAFIVLTMVIGIFWKGAKG